MSNTVLKFVVLILIMCCPLLTCSLGYCVYKDTTDKRRVKGESQQSSCIFRRPRCFLSQIKCAAFDTRHPLSHHSYVTSHHSYATSHHSYVTSHHNYVTSHHSYVTGRHQSSNQSSHNPSDWGGGCWATFIIFLCHLSWSSDAFSNSATGSPVLHPISSLPTPAFYIGDLYWRAIRPTMPC